MINDSFFVSTKRMTNEHQRGEILAYLALIHTGGILASSMVVCIILEES